MYYSRNSSQINDSSIIMYKTKQQIKELKELK